MSENTNDIEEIIGKIIAYRDENNIHLLSKFTVKYVISLIEKDKIAQIEHAFKEYDKKGVDIIDFVRIFLNIIEHNSSETLYLIMSLVELFRIISENLNMASNLKCQDITNFVCDSYIENSMDDYILKTKKLPEPKKFSGGKPIIREIDMNAPVIYGISEESLKRLVQNRLATDSSHHNNQSIKMGHFAKEVKKVFALDSLSDRINMYDLDCKLEKSLKQKSLKENKDVIILSFAWSNRQQRIGATLKDFSLIFWDSHDNFEFQKRFFINNFSNEYQTNIWYIDFLNMWITTDRTNVLNSWDLESESLLFQLSHKKIANTIIDVIEMPVIKLISVGSLDRLVTIWDVTKKRMVHLIDMTIGGIHSLIYFNSYQILVSAGYENCISVYQINPFFLEHDIMGKLVGHNSMVTAIQCIENTPLLISSDDNGILKLWDIRSFKCVQTVDLGSKTVITKILDIGVFGKVCFLGSRLNFLDFDGGGAEHKEKEQDSMYAIKVEYNYLNDELVICTRKDLRFLNLETGRIKKIYKGLLRKSDDEITIFKCVEQNKKFIIGDHRGGLTMFHYNTGEKCGNLIGHTNEISTLKVDFTNKLYISAGWDSLILIQKEEKNHFEVKREVKNCFFGKEINLLDVSIYHNIMVMISNNKTIYLWDYEYCRIISSIELEEGVEPTNVVFINGYGVMLISATNCKVYIVHFETKDQSMDFRLLSIINLENFDKKDQEDSSEENDDKSEEKSSPKINEIQTPNSPVRRSSTYSPNTRVSNYFNFRRSVMDKIEEEGKKPHLEENSEEFKIKMEKKIANTSNKMVVDLDYARDEEDPKQCKLLLGLLRGGIRIYDIFPLFKEFKLEMMQHSNKRINYNAYRGAKEDFYAAVKKVKNDPFIITNHDKKKLLKLNHSILANFQAHKEQMTTLNIITLSEKRILSSSMDGFIKIWGFKGEKLAIMNINHPLPIIWTIHLDGIKRTRKNILFGLKIVELIFRRYKRSILLSEEKNLNVNNFLSFLATTSTPRPLYLPPLDKSEGIAKKTKLLQEEYSPRDLHFERVKHIYQRDLMGPSLKEMEANKHVQIAQKIWRSELESSEDKAKFFAKDYLSKKFEEKAFREKDALLFFEQDFREKLENIKGYDDYQEAVQKLSKRLENSLKKKRMTSIHKKKQSNIINESARIPTSKKNVVLPALPVVDEKETAKMKINRSKTHDGPSILSNNTTRQNLLEYASARNLLDSTDISKNLLVSQNVSVNRSQFSNEWKLNFKSILKNLDKKLKKSQLYIPKMSLPKRNSQVLINLLDDSQFSAGLPKHKKKSPRSPKKGKSPRHKYDASTFDSQDALNSHDSQNEIDNMLEEILKSVQEKVRKKLEAELLLRKKEWEVETKRKIMLEFRELDKTEKEQLEIQKQNEKLKKEKVEMGFEGLGRIFMNLNKF